MTSKKHLVHNFASPKDPNELPKYYTKENVESNQFKNFWEKEAYFFKCFDKKTKTN